MGHIFCSSSHCERRHDVSKIPKAIDVCGWDESALDSPYPEGARDKKLLFAPDEDAPEGILPGHRYMFKKSFSRYPEQYWVEVVACILGDMLGIPVPPTLPAYDSSSGECGALIEWFLGYPDRPAERYVAGGDYLQRVVPEFERKTGAKHSFSVIHPVMRVFSPLLDCDWVSYWSGVLFFDALIGNTDRHQDNWGLIWRDGTDAAPQRIRFAPAFDNGTSMGHEIVTKSFHKFEDIDYLDRYIARGKHHMKWHLKDAARTSHIEFIGKLCGDYPQAGLHLRGVLSRVLLGELEEGLLSLTRLQLPVPLTEGRVSLMLRLLRRRYILLHELLTDIP